VQGMAVLIIALALPAPYRVDRPYPPRRTVVQQLERSPMWGKDPVRVAKFATLPDFASRDAQLKAQEQGRKSYEAYLAPVARGKFAIVGQIQQQLPSTPPAAGAAPPIPHSPNPVTAHPRGW
jgi:hypothetical protein